MPIFFSPKGSTVLIKIMKNEIGVTVLVFAVELQKVRTKRVFSDVWERTGARFEMACHQQHACCLRHAHSQHIESYLGKKKPQAKILIAFLFSQLHFNNVTSDSLFYGGHLVMCSKRCTVQTQWITLNPSFRTQKRLPLSPFPGPDFVSSEWRCPLNRSVPL